MAKRGTLTARQQLFVKEYLVDLNGLQAAKRAGYRGADSTLAQTAAENLNKPYIAAAIHAKFSQRALVVETRATKARVVEELCRLSYSDIRDYVEWDKAGVRLKASATLPPDASRCIKEISETSFKGEKTITFKLHDKVSALDKLGRHLGLYVEADGATLAQGALALEAFREMVRSADTIVIPPAIAQKNGHA